MLDDVGFASDHEAVAPVDSPHAAARPAVDVVDAPVGEVGGTADVISVVGVAAVDDDVSSLHVGGEVFDGLASDVPGWHHHPDCSRTRQLLDEVGHRAGPGGTILLQILDSLWDHVEDHAAVTIAHQAADDVGAHPPESNHPDLHRVIRCHRRSPLLAVWPGSSNAIHGVLDDFRPGWVQLAFLADLSLVELRLSIGVVPRCLGWAACGPYCCSDPGAVLAARPSGAGPRTPPP